MAGLVKTKVVTLLFALTHPIRAISEFSGWLDYTVISWHIRRDLKVLFQREGARLECTRRTPQVRIEMAMRDLRLEFNPFMSVVGVRVAPAHSPQAWNELGQVLCVLDGREVEVATREFKSIYGVARVLLPNLERIRLALRPECFAEIDAKLFPCRVTKPKEQMRRLVERLQEHGITSTLPTDKAGLDRLFDDASR